MAIWQKYGLGKAGWLRAAEPEARYVALSRAARFRLALEEGAGLHLHFARFLAGRADLLPATYLYELRKVKRDEYLPSIAAPLELAGLAPDLSLIRREPGRDVFKGTFRGKAVVVEAHNAGTASTDERKWDLFHREIRALRDPEASAVSEDTVLQQFQEWVRLHSDLERRRSILVNLRERPSHSLSRFPKLIPELQSPRWMGYEAMEGLPADKALAESEDPAKTLDMLAEGFLEQCLLLSLIDAEFELQELLILKGDGDDGVAYRTLPALVSVPVESHQDLLQYMVAAVAGDTPRAVQKLCRMCAGRESYRAEARLLRELSSLRPELKVNVATPESVTALETYSRALAQSDLRPPLFLQLLHRNITLLGQYNEAVNPSADAIEEALWPVLGRLLRFHAGQVVSSGRLQEWAASSSLLFMTAGRQMAVALEKLRDNETRWTEEADLRGDNSRDTQLNRRTAGLLRTAILLVVFLFSVQVSLSSGEDAYRWTGGIAAVASGVGLWLSVLGIR
jgi:predicted unusual protein kinase regulating ubiquinone biosynthesis (AarF/ABC1/UbiB family)